MSTNATLSATRRDGTGKGVARKLRAQGQVPAVVYGKDMESVHVQVDAHEAEHLFKGISVASTIVDLNIDGEKRPLPTLVREVQTHPYRPELLHIDFLRIQKGVAVEVEVPLHLEGTPEGVRTDGGILEQIVHEIPVKCLPSKIPEAIVVDVTGLNVGDSLHVSDLDADEDVQILMDADRTIVNVAAPRVIEEVVEEVVEEAEGEEPTAAAEAEGGAAEAEEAAEDES
jgi:large subunit ribosomal protein L25